MDQLPFYAEWPVFREMLFAFGEVLNFIFNQLNSIGIVNVTLSVILFSLFYQLLFLPFNMRSSLNASKAAALKAELAQLKKEYADRLSDPAIEEEYKKKQEAITKKGKNKIKGIGCLFFFVQLSIMMCLLNALAYMKHYVRLFETLSEAEIDKAFSLFGLNIELSPSEAWWPAILLVLLYVAVFFLPGEIKRRIEAKKERAAWLASLSEEERAIAEAEKGKFDAFNILMGSVRYITPIMIVWLSIRVPCFFIVYWIFNVIWKAILMRLVKLLYEKAWPAIKKMFRKKTEEGMLDVEKC